MEKKYFPLGTSADNRFVRVLRIIFGIACIAMAAYWIYFNLNSLKTDWTLWITIVFLICFGLYQLWAAAGRSVTFIEFSENSIRLKKNVILPPVEIKSAEIMKIDIFPLSIVFHRKSGADEILRLGTVHYETNEKIVDEIISFAETNNLGYEVNEETI